MSDFSQEALQAERDVFLALSPEEQATTRENLIAGATALNNVRNAELALRGNLRYIETREGLNLLFRGLLQPLGVPEEHVRAMLATKEPYPGLKHYEADPRTGRVSNYIESDTPTPEIIQKRLTATTLREIIKDQTEIARIEEAVKNGGEYPLFSYFSPTAIHMYAEFMRKYTNNPRIRVFADNTESKKFLQSLPGDTNGEKFDNTGIPMPGVFFSDDAEVVFEGEWAYWVALARYGKGFDARCFHRDNRDSNDYWLTFNGSSPLLIEDIAR